MENISNFFISPKKERKYKKIKKISKYIFKNQKILSIRMEKNKRMDSDLNSKNDDNNQGGDVQPYVIDGVLTSQCVCLDAHHPHVRCTGKISGPDGLCDDCRKHHFTGEAPIIARACQCLEHHRSRCFGFASNENGLCPDCNKAHPDGNRSIMEEQQVAV
jgi:hypothetical protein